jgi:hypothetical protein
LNYNLESLECSQAIGLAGLAGRDWPDAAAIDKTGGIAAIMASCRDTLEPHLQSEQRQGHPATAAELATFDPGREPAATQYRLVFDVRRRDAVARDQTEAFDPKLTAARSAEAATDLNPETSWRYDMRNRPRHTYIATIWAYEWPHSHNRQPTEDNLCSDLKNARERARELLPVKEVVATRYTWEREQSRSSHVAIRRRETY